MKYSPFSRRSSVLLALGWLSSASLAHADPGAKRPPDGVKLAPVARPTAAKSTAPCVTQPTTARPVEPTVAPVAPATPATTAPTATSGPVAPSPWSTAAPAATMTVSLPAPSVAILIENARRAPREARAPLVPGSGAAGPLADLPGAPRMTSREKMALVTAGVGLVSLGVMTGFGLRAMSRLSEHEAGCASETGCTQAAGEALDSARTAAHISHAFGLLGALSLGTSAYLFFFRSDAKPRRVGVMPIFGLAKDVGLAAGGMTMKASW